MYADDSGKIKAWKKSIYEIPLDKYFAVLLHERKSLHENNENSTIQQAQIFAYALIKICFFNLNVFCNTVRRNGLTTLLAIGKKVFLLSFALLLLFLATGSLPIKDKPIFSTYGMYHHSSSPHLPLFFRCLFWNL